MEVKSHLPIALFRFIFFLSAKLFRVDLNKAGLYLFAFRNRFTGTGCVRTVTVDMAGIQ